MGNEFTAALTELGRTYVAIELGWDSKGVVLGCRPTVTRSGNDVRLTAQQVTFTSTMPPSGYCSTAAATVGPLDPGDYRLLAQVLDANGAAVWADQKPFTVTPRGAKCNVDPYQNGAILLPAKRSAEEVATLLSTNIAYRALVGEVDYGSSLKIGSYTYVLVAFPVLADPARVLDKLQRSGEFLSVEPNGMFCFSPPPSDVVSALVEYHNVLLDHYFMTPDAGEQQAIDAGSVGPGWVRTGLTYQVVTHPGCPVGHEGGFHPVYRFTGEPNVGPSSHFFTVDQNECAVVRDRTEWHWQFEGAPFWAAEAVNGACPSRTTPLYRVYNNGKGGTPNHRYVGTLALANAMVAQGWVLEGITMCVR